MYNRILNNKEHATAQDFCVVFIFHLPLVLQSSHKRFNSKIANFEDQPFQESMTRIWKIYSLLT